MLKDALTSTQLRRELKIASYVIENLIRQRAIPEPMMFGGRRLWMPKDVENIKDVLRGRGFSFDE